jgi:hypothetical protein
VLLLAQHINPEDGGIMLFRNVGSRFLISTTSAARERLGKHVPGVKDTHATEERCCLRGPCRGVVRKTVGATKSVLYERLWRGDLNAEAEESPLLEIVARERLVNSQQAEKGLAGVLVICEL